MGLIQYYQITSQPVNHNIRIFVIMLIVFCNLVSIKCIIVYYKGAALPRLRKILKQKLFHLQVWTVI